MVHAGAGTGPFIGQRVCTCFRTRYHPKTTVLFVRPSFRKVLKDKGEDPDNLVLSRTELLLSEYDGNWSKIPPTISDDTSVPPQAALYSKSRLFS